MRVFSSLVIAFSTYSRLPMPRVDWTDNNRRYALCFFPLIGLAVGGMLALWLWVCDLLGLNAFLRGAIGAVIPLLVTGGIHMDGLMDTSDALASWQPQEKRLEILKDHHVGAFAVMVCAGYLLIMAGLLSECTVKNAVSLTACFALSRAASAALSVTLKPARPGGMLEGFARTAAGKAVLICAAVYGLCGVFAACARSPWGMLIPAALGLVTVYYIHMARKNFGGVTGDLAGWFLQMAELGMIAAVVLEGKLL
ncbi:MAG: adenosylcobinamide-GDP ribazoletransferase [Clostridia bacterium]|nr:adenosylcobinamide-GDP ribazoletransferase [Clostridia bacterium]